MDRRKDEIMIIKIIGAGLVMAGSGAVGISMAATHRTEIKNLKLLISALDYMACELRYHLTPLPELLHQAGTESIGMIRNVLLAFSSELERQVTPDVRGCMDAVLSTFERLPPVTKNCLNQLGSLLGRFDIDGQLINLDAARTTCRTALEELEDNKDARIRSYQTLSLCAGAALAIIMI